MGAKSKLTRALVAQRPRRLFRHCCYCGHPSIGVACPCHRDLLELDPIMFFDPRLLLRA
jgi:hypothetical protein